MPKRNIEIDKIKKEIVNAYNSGLDMRSISSSYNLSYDVVRSRLIKWGIHQKEERQSTKIALPKHDIIRAYSNGNSSAEIGKQFGVCPNIIINRLTDWGVKIRRYGEWNKKRVNHNAFDVISPAAAYWMGVLAGDGCVSTGRATPVIILEMKDLEHVQKFIDFMCAEHEITESRGTYKVAFSSKNVAQKLNAVGIGMNKSYSLSINSDELIKSPDFLRGVIDADGGIYDYGSTKKISVYSASPKFVQQIMTIFKRWGLTPKKYKQRNGWHVCLLRKSEIKRAITLLGYLDQNKTALDRKRRAALLFMENN